MEKFAVGKCETMCPLDEIKMRTENKLLHFYERKAIATNSYEADEPKVVKEFARSAAGIRLPKPRDLRTPNTLRKTIEYLLFEIFSDTRKPFHFVYDFIFDRLRAVRQEIVMQNFDELLSIELLEPICMFLAYSLYRLIEEPLDKFDPKICRQHLQECLKKVLSSYDSVEPNSINQSNREIIESMYLLFNLGDGEALARAIALPKFIKNGETFHPTLKLSLSFWRKNFYRSLLEISQLPHMLCAIASIHIPMIRREIMKSFSLAYQSQVLTVPVQWLAKLLIYHKLDYMIEDFRYYGITINGEIVRFSKAEFRFEQQLLKPRKEKFVENQLVEPIHQYFMLQI